MDNTKHLENIDNMDETAWRARLTPEQFCVLRQEATERPFTGQLLNEHRTGRFHCAGCNEPLFESGTKFESGSGWPSFFAPIPGKTDTKTDIKLMVPRTEIHCVTCGGHLGHVFEDGPQPTGLRYCINSAALTFTPENKAS